MLITKVSATLWCQLDALQRPQERDELCALLQRHLQSKLMPHNRSPLHTNRIPSRRFEIRPQARGVEHLFERGQRSIMQEPAAIPHALERRHLVIACPLAREHCATRI